MRVTKNDDCIWFTHIPPDMAAHLGQLAEGEDVRLSINGAETVWRRMKDGRDGRQTNGLRLQRGEAHWNTIARGASFELEFVGLVPREVATVNREATNEARSAELAALIPEIKRFAIRYRELTGRPLGVTGEIAEYEAARLMGVTLMPAREAGHDATLTTEEGVLRIQIKGRVRMPESKKSQRVGSIKLSHEWDALWFIVLDEKYDAVSIHAADRRAVEDELRRPGSKSRNERGALAANQLLRISKQIWPV